VAKSNPWTHLLWWTAILACLVGFGVEALDLAIPRIAMAVTNLLTAYGPVGIVGAIMLTAMGRSLGRQRGKGHGSDDSTVR
jgi:hypothetical protein